MSTEENGVSILVHDLDLDQFKRQFPGIERDYRIISNEKSINGCTCCFACWWQTPLECSIKDGYEKLGALFCVAKNIVFISRCVYGGFSPFVKKVQDRRVADNLPFFKIHRDNRVHQQPRSENRPRIFIHFYGDITEGERRTAEEWASIGDIIMNSHFPSIHFYKTAEEITGGGLCG